jgi:hypothetical protein
MWALKVHLSTTVDEASDSVLRTRELPLPVSRLDYMITLGVS